MPKPSKNNKVKRPMGRRNILTPKSIGKVLVQVDGVVAEAARVLGVSEDGARKYLKAHPEVQELVKDKRALALHYAGITRGKAYKKVAEGMEAKTIANRPNWKERRESTKVALTLMGDLEEVKEGAMGGVVINMPVVVIDGNPLKFKVGNNQ